MTMMKVPVNLSRDMILWQLPTLNTFSGMATRNMLYQVMPTYGRRRTGPRPRTLRTRPQAGIAPAQLGWNSKLNGGLAGF